MFLNIVTPCIRFENLHIIAKSINIPLSWRNKYSGINIDTMLMVFMPRMF
jgi:hypothetical protein